jgi:hypothetical protein
MSSHNSFAALASFLTTNPFIRSSTPAPTPVAPSVESAILKGTKRPRSSTQLLTPPRAPPAPPQATPASNPRLQDSDNLVFDVLNIFRSRWFINREHLIANTLSATRDSDGRFTWVDFLPAFHTSLVKRMCTLLPPGFMVAHGKWVLFVFILEILTGDKGPKPKVFWHARKKRSRASQKVRLAMSTMSASPAPTPVPIMSLVPCAQSTSMVAPLPEVAPPRREDDVSMGSHPVIPTPSPATILPQGVHTSADFLKSFPWD